MAPKAANEIWFIVTKRGRRAFYYSRLAGRALPLKLADAELALATGAATEISKPEWIGR